ncbi:MAG: DUF2461 domain-containing protein [Calditrichia bacterium]
MSSDVAFKGFPKEAFQFFADLAKHNEKAWFEAHREVFTEKVLKPAQAFVNVLGMRLEKIAPEIVAVPRIDQSIFRLHRDTRFSADKKPYKTHLGIFLWEGPKKKLENPGFYIHLEPQRLFLGAGMHVFSKEALAVYRDWVVDPQHGPKLVKIIEKITQNPDFKLGGKHYKKVPRGFDPDHPHAELLKHNGMAFYFETGLPPEVHTAAFVDYVYQKFEAMAPLHYWLREMNSAV